jgi:hypothetical protein
MNRLLTEKKDELEQLCKRYKVKTMYVFGSACTDKFKDDSDIDFLISFDKVPIEEYADNYFDLYYQLQALFNREIDLVTENSLSNPYFIKGVEQTKRLIYAA